MYEIVFKNLCKKDFKKLDQDAQKFIRYVCLKKITDNPQDVGGKLQGNAFKGYLAYKTRYKSVDYRIIYKIKDNELIIIFVMIASRENFYKRLKRRI